MELTDIEVKSSEHRTVNSSRGIIRCPDLKVCSTEQIVDEMKDQAVTRYVGITDKNEERTDTLIITFDRPQLPKFVTVGYLHVPGTPYIPNHIRCHNCQKFGHGKSSCKMRTVCARCSESDHTDTHCHNLNKCAIARVNIWHHIWHPLKNAVNGKLKKAFWSLNLLKVYPLVKQENRSTNDHQINYSCCCTWTGLPRILFSFKQHSLGHYHSHLQLRSLLKLWCLLLPYLVLQTFQT